MADTHPAYGKRIAAEVAARITAAYPLVPIHSRDYDQRAWVTRVEFRPPGPDAVPIWLTVKTDDRFVLTAGDTYRWMLPFVPEDPQVDEIVEEISQLADHGVLAVRANRWLGAFSPSFVGSPGVDDYLDDALKGRFAKVLERRSGWVEPTG